MLRLAKRAAELALSKVSYRYKLNYRGHGSINLIDVGSVGGLPRPWRENANLVRFLLNFEPNDSPCSGDSFMTYNTALWDEETIRPFYVYKGANSTGSSLFQQNVDFVRSNYETLKTRGPKKLSDTWFDRSELVKVMEMKCRTLDSVLADHFPSTPFHFLKTDAQGAEYQILNGSKNLLSGSCLGLYLELFTIPLYEGIFLMDEVSNFVGQYGFKLVRKLPAHGSFDSQHDCLFLKESDSPLTSTIKRIYRLTP